MSGLRVLLTNVWMDRLGGTESVIRDVSMGLLRRGHRPTVYSPHIGDPARALHEHGVAITTDLATIREPPDVIHGQHFVQTAEALLHFPDTPAVQLCHAWGMWQEGPAHFPQIHRYLAVDETVRDRLCQMEGVAPERVEVLPNAVDLARIPQRRPLPPKPKRALAFTKFSAHVPLVREACRQRGLTLDVLGRGGDRLVANPESELVGYDLVFATARMALEALCCGCAVIVCDARGFFGLVTSETYPTLRPLNFGLRALAHPIGVAAIGAAIDAYNPVDAAQVAFRARREADVGPMLDRLETTYREAMTAPRPSADAVRTAAQKFLRGALPRTRSDGRWPWMQERDALQARIETLDRELAEARAQALQAKTSGPSKGR